MILVAFLDLTFLLSIGIDSRNGKSRKIINFEMREALIVTSHSITTFLISN